MAPQPTATALSSTPSISPKIISEKRMQRERLAATARPERKSADHATGAVVFVAATVPTLLAVGLWALVGTEPLGKALPYLSLDLRSLALGRVLMGAVLLLDLRERVRDLHVFYTDDSCLPRHIALGGGDPRLRQTDVSFYFATGAAPTVALLFCCSAGFAVSLMVGYCTKLSCFLSWLHWRSIEARNGPIHQAGDLLLRLMLWWGLFLPLGAVFSVDAWLMPEEATVHPFVTGLPVVGYMLQLGSVYFFTSLVKVDRSWLGGFAVELTCRNYRCVRALVALRSLPLNCSYNADDSSW